MQVKEQQLNPDMEQQTGFKLGKEYVKALYCQFSSVAQSCSTLCDPMDFSTPGLPVHHQLPEFKATWPASWEICMQVRNQQLELDMEQ